MKSFDESDKSKKTLASMIEKPDATGTNNNLAPSKKKGQKSSVSFSPKIRETVAVNENGNITNESDDSRELDEASRQANLAKMMSKKG